MFVLVDVFEDHKIQVTKMAKKYADPDANAPATWIFTIQVDWMTMMTSMANTSWSHK